MASNNVDKTRDLRLIDSGEEGGGERKPPAPPTGGGPGGTGELVSEVILDSGLLPQDKIDAARARASGGGTFADALVEEGFASSLGVARSLAEQYHLPLVDLAIAGVDAGAAKLIPLRRPRARLRDPVRERRQDDQGRDHEPAGRARSRRAEVRDAPQRRVPRRRSQRRADRAAPPRARGRGDERDVPRHDRDRRRRGGRPERPRSRRRDLRCPARPPRQLDDLPGGRGRRVATSTSSRRRTS